MPVSTTGMPPHTLKEDNVNEISTSINEEDHVAKSSKVSQSSEKAPP